MQQQAGRQMVQGRVRGRARDPSPSNCHQVATSGAGASACSFTRVLPAAPAAAGAGCTRARVPLRVCPSPGARCARGLLRWGGTSSSEKQAGLQRQRRGAILQQLRMPFGKRPACRGPVGCRQPLGVSELSSVCDGIGKMCDLVK